jgi:hypothetical protein
MIKAINRATGEVLELPADTLRELIDAWNVAKEYKKTSEAISEQVKPLIDKYMAASGLTEEVDGQRFRVTVIQRKNYDKAVMRNVLDEDTFDLLLKPDKTVIDNYLKEHLEDLGEASTILRTSMVDEGKPYEVVKLEKLNA